jgi:hypothetical protein
MSMMAVIAMSPIDRLKRRAPLSQSGAKGNRRRGNYCRGPDSRSANFCHHKSCASRTVVIYGRVRAGRNRRSFAMSQLSGIVSLFLIAAAFLTSCDHQEPQQSSMELSTLHAAE